MSPAWTASPFLSSVFWQWRFCGLEATWIGAGTMEIGDITALTEYTILILFYLMMAQMVIILLPRARVCLERIGEVLDREPEIRDGEEQQGEGLPERRTVEEGEPVVSFENVSFRFADADEDTLSGLAFSCRRGRPRLS